VATGVTGEPTAPVVTPTRFASQTDLPLSGGGGASGSLVPRFDSKRPLWSMTSP
jgi:hypothetical protein